VYEEDFIEVGEERELLAGIGGLALAEAQYKGYTAKRRIASFGSRYDFDANLLQPAAELPGFLLPLRQKVARWTGQAASDFGDALVTEYPPGTTLGWHRDVPQFAIVVGVSLASACRMRFRPYPVRANARAGTFDLTLAPRSAYVLRDDVRWAWQHSVPPTPALRYSITFRTRRHREARPAS
jgi:alkylated DNA repair dioxygenase AlkB